MYLGVADHAIDSIAGGRRVHDRRNARLRGVCLPDSLRPAVMEVRVVDREEKCKKKKKGEEKEKKIRKGRESREEKERESI